MWAGKGGEGYDWNSLSALNPSPGRRGPLSAPHLPLLKPRSPQLLTDDQDDPLRQSFAYRPAGSAIL